MSEQRESRVDTGPTIGQVAAYIATLLPNEADVFRRTYAVALATDPVLARDFLLALDALCAIFHEGE